MKTKDILRRVEEENRSNFRSILGLFSDRIEAAQPHCPSIYCVLPLNHVGPCRHNDDPYLSGPIQVLDSTNSILLEVEKRRRKRRDEKIIELELELAEKDDMIARMKEGLERAIAVFEGMPKTITEDVMVGVMKKYPDLLAAAVTFSKERQGPLWNTVKNILNGRSWR